MRAWYRDLLNHQETTLFTPGLGHLARFCPSPLRPCFWEDDVDRREWRLQFADKEVERSVLIPDLDTYAPGDRPPEDYAALWFAARCTDELIRMNDSGRRD
ncbi:hypothetical protein F1880_000938 [Penicillium rolfsii]|nr:hypothetical protein F1880_000938 [Penicillium rolfsii]